MFVVLKMLPFRVLPYVLLALAALGVSSAHAQETDQPTVDPISPLPGFDVSNFDSVDAQLQDCPQDQIAFELITGLVYSAPADMLDSQPGTLMITDCIDLCRRNKSCMAVNFETGLCVLFSSNADMYPGALTLSQFPVFTLYLQKNCMRQSSSCSKAWNFERVIGYELNGFAKKRTRVSSRLECQEFCLAEQEFPCRSANFNNVTGECHISDMDRHTSVSTGTFREADNNDFMENNCVENPVRLCEFQRMEERILKTVDSVFQDVGSLDECKELCLAAPYRCHSFDFGDTGDGICRLSHHAAATLVHIAEPYLEIPGASTYELSSCFNVTIDCRSGDMVASIKTSKIFNGKIYAKGSPTSCVRDVSNTLEFQLTMPYNDVDCNVKRDTSSRYSNDVIIQHHDMIVTSADLGLSVHCQYDLSNKSVSNRVDLQVTGEIESAMHEERIVDSPNVIMRVTDSAGNDMASASVGDMLELRFEIVDHESPYEIFVRDLIAMDGGDQNQITLLDSQGCPTEMSIMRPLLKIDDTGKILGASFDAFKFPTSEIVQFRALVTPCLPTCEPVVCDVMDFGGQIQQTPSYGRRKRSLRTSWTSFDLPNNRREEIVFDQMNHLDIYVHPVDTNTSLVERRRRETSKMPEEMLVVKSIKISDKFGFRSVKKGGKGGAVPDGKEELSAKEAEMVLTEQLSGPCINTVGLVLSCSVFLVAQLILIVAWTAVWHKRRRNKLEEPLSHATTTESLRQLYDSGYPRRI